MRPADPRGREGDDQAIDTAVEYQAREDLLAAPERLVSCAECVRLHQQYQLSGLRGLGLDARHHLAEARVVERWDDHREGVCAARAQALRHRVGPVLEHPGGVEDPIAGLRSHLLLRVVAKHARGRRRIDARQARHILNRRRASLVLAAVAPRPTVLRVRHQPPSTALRQAAAIRSTLGIT